MAQTRLFAKSKHISGHPALSSRAEHKMNGVFVWIAYEIKIMKKSTHRF